MEEGTLAYASLTLIGIRPLRGIRRSIDKRRSFVKIEARTRLVVFVRQFR